MLSYVVGFLAFMLLGYNPLVQLLQGLAPGPPRIQRTLRPHLQEELLALEDRNGSICSRDTQYRVHIFSREPLVIYVENFLASDEREHLLEVRYAACSFSMISNSADPPLQQSPLQTFNGH
jgi:prolyl 4-hydroxylase